MKTTALFLSTFALTLAAFASPHSELLKATLEKEPTCQNFVRADENNIYLGTGPYLNSLTPHWPRPAVPGTLTITSLQNNSTRQVYKTLDGAIDAISSEGHLYVLTYSHIEDFDQATMRLLEVYPITSLRRVLQYKEHGTGMVLYKNKLVITNGRLGITIFDLATHKISNEIKLVPSQLPLESMATGIALHGSTAYVVIDNFTLVDPPAKPPFRGILTLDLDSETLMSQLDGMDPGADAIVTNGQNLFVSFMGIPIFRFGIENLGGSGQLEKPEYRAFHFTPVGHPTGRPMIDDTYYYTCFEVADENAGTIKNRPLALSRKDLKL